MKVTRGRLVAVGAGVVVLVVLAAAMRPRPLAVDAATAVRGPLETTVDAEGRTRVRERYVVTAPVSGRVERIRLVEGMPIRGGDPVARITPLPLDAQTELQARARVSAAEAARRVAEGQVPVARAALAQARLDAQRAHRLAEAGGVAPRDVEQADLALRQAEETAHAATERATAARADVAQARAALVGLGAGSRGGVIVVRAPTGGRVLRVPERSERVVAAGTALLELGDPRTLEVVADVLSSDGADIRAGDAVRLAGWGGNGDEGETLAGRVRDVEPSAFTKISALGVEEQRVNVIVDVPSPPSAVGDGFRVNVSVVTWSAPDVLTVPTSALVRERDEWIVYAITDGRARRRPVRVGHLGATAAEVLGGIDVGTRVVAFPSDKVSEGARVAAR